MGTLLIDTNTLLDAAFDGQSVSGRSLEAIIAERHLVIADRETIDEAFRILLKVARELSMPSDRPAAWLGQVIKSKLLVVEPAPGSIPTPKVNSPDAYLARAAQHYDATLVTNDAELVVQCRRIDVAADFPWNVLSDLRPETLSEDVIRISPLRPQGGTLFARCTPAGWRGQANVGTFGVFACEGLGRLLYDTHTASWVFQPSRAASLVLPFPEAGQDTTIVALSYKARGQDLHVTLRAGCYQGGNTTLPHTYRAEDFDPPGATKLGGDGTPFGYIRHIVIGPLTLDSRTWKTMCALHDGAPTPGNYELLRTALRFWRLISL